MGLCPIDRSTHLCIHTQARPHPHPYPHPHPIACTASHRRTVTAHTLKLPLLAPAASRGGPDAPLPPHPSKQPWGPTARTAPPWTSPVRSRCRAHTLAGSVTCTNDGGRLLHARTVQPELPCLSMHENETPRGSGPLHGMRPPWVQGSGSGSGCEGHVPRSNASMPCVCAPAATCVSKPRACRHRPRPRAPRPFRAWLLLRPRSMMDAASTGRPARRTSLG